MWATARSARPCKSGAELVVACPGRLEDLIQSGFVSLSDVNQVVIDEADRMADMGFLPAVRRLLELTSDERQVLLFSATFDKAVSKLAGDVQRNPVVHEIGRARPRHRCRPPHLLAGRPHRACRGHGGRHQGDGLDDRVLSDADTVPIDSPSSSSSSA